MPEARDRPYCIWHPQVASQDTYRKPWQQYPDMSYQVARACAVANYVELYLEMNLLPDVSVAEEAHRIFSLYQLGIFNRKDRVRHLYINEAIDWT